MVQLYENYENRVKNFITEMTQPSQQIVVQDPIVINNTREDLMKSREMKKPFIFKGYKTEQDRIKDTIKRNRYLFNLEEPSEDTKNKNNSTNKSPEQREKNSHEKLKSLAKSDVIIQPQMRFKARTDLERVFDALTGNYRRQGEREILNRQLRYLDLYDGRKPIDILLEEEKEQENEKKDEKNEEGSKGNTDANKTKQKQILKKFYDGKPRKPWVKRTNINIEATGILSEYHHKTHFKATEEIAENKIDWKKIKSRRDASQAKKKILPALTKSYPNYSETGRSAVQQEQQKEYIYDGYNKNQNPIYKKDKISCQPGSMDFLTSLAFSNFNEEEQKETEENSPNLNNKVSFSNDIANFEQYPIKKNMNLADDNNIFIGDQLYNKGTQFDMIASRVLNICNIYQSKSRHNNKKLKKGEGKLMMTRGMTLSQFEKKYNLKD